MELCRRAGAFLAAATCFSTLLVDSILKEDKDEELELAVEEEEDETNDGVVPILVCEDACTSSESNLTLRLSRALDCKEGEDSSSAGGDEFVAAATGLLTIICFFSTRSTESMVNLREDGRARD